MVTVPPGPVAAALAVVVRGDAVVLVRRANPPDAGLWGFPGGKVELGETVGQAAVRELREETGVVARALRPFAAVDALERADRGKVVSHFVLVAVLCAWVSGEPVAGDDALEARWFVFDELLAAGTPKSLDVDAVARRAREMAGRA